MKEYRNEIVTMQKTLLKSMTCDICNRAAKSPEDYDDPWNGERYDVNKVTLEHEVGEAYPEDRFTTTTTWDICPECFQKHILSRLMELGAPGSKEDS